MRLELQEKYHKAIVERVTAEEIDLTNILKIEVVVHPLAYGIIKETGLTFNLYIGGNHDQIKVIITDSEYIEKVHEFDILFEDHPAVAAETWYEAWRRDRTVEGDYIAKEFNWVDTGDEQTIEGWITNSGYEVTGDHGRMNKDITIWTSVRTLHKLMLELGPETTIPKEVSISSFQLQGFQLKAIEAYIPQEQEVHKLFVTYPDEIRAWADNGVAESMNPLDQRATKVKMGDMDRRVESMSTELDDKVEQGFLNDTEEETFDASALDPQMDALRKAISKSDEEE